MSQVNIYEKGWIDLVFEGKNKAYGAYQLRQQDSRTTIKALFLGMLLIVTASGLIMLLSSFGEKPNVEPVVDPGTKIDLSDVNYPEPETPKTETAAPSKPVEETEKKMIDDPKVVQANQNPDDVLTNKEMKDKQNSLPENPGTGTGTNPNPGGSEGGTAIIPATTPGGTGKPIDNGISRTTELDKMPEYPGGIKKFYEYVGNNFKNPDVDIDQATVVMSFVIERDGKMTDIKALRSPGYGLEKEAIRVLKALKTKWTPGVKNGEYVRTQYTLPITVRIN